jgi:ATP-dependent helicase/nuclease subunit A
VDAVAMRRRALAVPTYRAAPVKVRAGELSEYEEQVRRGVGPAGRGVDWGSAVHGALEAAAQHGLAGVRLREHCRGLLIAADRPVTRRGEPTELDELVETVAAVLASPLFARVRAAGNVQIEAPFALALDAAEYRVLAAAAGPAAAGGPPREIIEGVIDLAFREGDGWTLVDYKSDQAGARIDAARRAKYRAQVDLYAAAWQRITGEPVKERTLLFTADGSVESW